MLTTLGARVLGPAQASTIEQVLAADPFASCMVAARFDPTMSSNRMGGEFWGVTGGRSGVCFAGPNLIPLAGDGRAMRAFAGMAQRRGRRCASIMGRSELVIPIWEQLADGWGPARAVRWEQPLLTCPKRPVIAADPLVHLARPQDLEIYFPAAVAMFLSEIGTDPRLGDDGRSYRSRIADLIAGGRAFARIEGGQVIFKAEVGAVSETAALIQGVWVNEQFRGRGIGAAGMAAVVRAVQEGMRRTPCLYVNDFNTAARAVYAKVGFSQVAAFTSVLF